MAANLTPAEKALLDKGDRALATCQCTHCPLVAARSRQLADFMRKAIPDSSDADLARSLMAVVQFIGPDDIAADLLGLLTWAACELTRLERTI